MNQKVKSRIIKEKEDISVNIRPAPHLHSFGPAHIAIVCYAVPTKRIWGTGQTVTEPTRIFTYQHTGRAFVFCGPAGL